MHFSNSCFKFFFFILFFILGLINNFGYVFIISASSDIADKYGEASFMSLYLLSLLIFSFMTRTMNSKFCLQIPYKLRIFILSFYNFAGYILMYIILQIDGKSGFWLSLIPCMMLGTGCSFGESTILGIKTVNKIGYLRNFPNSLVAGWSSGTGLAGMGATIIYIFMNSLNVEKCDMFLYICWISLAYLACFFTVDYLFNLYKDNDEMKTSIIEIAAINTEDSEGGSLDDYKKNKSLTLENFMIAFSKSYKYIVNLFLVYYLEYCITPGFTDSIKKKVSSDGYPDFISSNLFSIMYFCYQIGVFISRTSLLVLKIKRIEILTLFQIINFVLLFIECFYPFLQEYYSLFCWLIFVGLMGGGSYVNCFYFLLEDKNIEKVYRELSVNIATVFNDIGVLSSSLTILLFKNTFMD